MSKDPRNFESLDPLWDWGQFEAFIKNLHLNSLNAVFWSRMLFLGLLEGEAQALPQLMDRLEGRWGRVCALYGAVVIHEMQGTDEQ